MFCSETYIQFKKNCGFNIFSIILIFQVSQPNKRQQNVPQAGLGHIGDIHRVVHQADARGSTALRGTGAGEDGQVRGPGSYGSRTPVGENPPENPPNLNKHTRQKWEKTVQIKKGGSELFGRVMFICCLPFFLGKKKSMNFIISFVRPKGVWLFPRCSPGQLGKTSLGGHAVGGPCSPEASRRLPQPGGFRRQRRGGGGGGGVFPRK